MVKGKGFQVAGIGKVTDIFADRGFTMKIPSKGNADTLDKIEQVMPEMKQGLLLANLVDFDMLYGHRNDSRGYAEALCYFDQRLHRILDSMHPDTLLMIVADHGCDPTTPSTDHSREYVPVLAYTPAAGKGIDLGTRSSFADVAKTIAQNFHISELSKGTSFLDEIV